MDYSMVPFSLLFNDKKIETNFRVLNAEKSLFQARLAVVLGIFLYAGFSWLDYTLSPGQYSTLFIIRLTVVVVFIACFVNTFLLPKYIELTTITALVAGQLGHYFLLIFGNFSPYYGYGTTIIIIVFMLTFSRIIFIKAVFIAALFIFGYEAIIIFILNYPFIDIMQSNYFLLSVTFTGILAGYTIERYIRLDYVKTINLTDEKAKSEKLLLNILPENVANELKNKGFTEPVHYESVTVLFTDFVGFTKISEELSPNELVTELSENFCKFDCITKKYNLEKIKTIGDSYMLAGGVPVSRANHTVDCVFAAIEIKEYMNRLRSERQKLGQKYWDLRIGINTGPLVAGVVGDMKFAYDIFGDTVNVANRIESYGVVNEINISKSTYDEIKYVFDCEYMGKVEMKGKGLLDIYVVNGIKEGVTQ